MAAATEIATGELEEETPKLPEEIIFDILTRLPAISLLKFRCVSKSWESLISSPSFVQSHLHQSASTAATSDKDSSFINRRLLLNVDGGPRGTTRSALKHVSLPSLMMEEPSSSIDANIQGYTEFEDLRSYIRLVGSHNGLFCFYINEWDLFLWNPTTRVHARLPSARRLDYELHGLYGFGYTCTTQDYKVCGLFCKMLSDGNYELDVRMYSRKANSWKTIESGNKFGIPCQSGKFVNGKLHFGVASMIGFRVAIEIEIFSVDLDTEMCGIVEQPDYGNDDIIGASLGVLEGCIYVLRFIKARWYARLADLWVLKEYGIKESWTILARIKVMDDDSAVGRSVGLKPLIVLPTGEILLVCCERLAIYSPRDDMWTYPEIRDLPSIIDGDIYIESLVSPQLN